MSPEEYERRKQKAHESRVRSFEKAKRKLKQSPGYRMREYLNLVRYTNRCGSKVNCFIYHPQNSDEHEDMKFQVFKQLRKWGHDVLVEPIFINGKRADILDITEGVIFEIFFTETVEELAKKVESYPPTFEVRTVNATEKFNEKLLL